jgi:hypothetical protein
MALLNPLVIPAAGLQAGLRSEFLSIYKETENTELADLGKIMRFGVPSTLRTETYPFSDGMPHPRRWAKGTPVPRESGEFKTFFVSNTKWGLRIEWDREDREDNQISNLYDEAREAGANWARLKRRVFFQMLLGSTNAALLASVPTAADGVNLFSGSTRFGHASGNIVTGNGVATTAAIHRDFFSAISRFQLYTNPKGFPLLDPNIAQRGVTIIHGAANLEVFQTAFRAMLVEKLVSAPTNIVPEVYRNISFMSVPEITDNDWYVALQGVQSKAFIEQERIALEETVSNVQSGSDDARENDLEFIQWRARIGYGIGMPYSIIQVNS